MSKLFIIGSFDLWYFSFDLWSLGLCGISDVHPATSNALILCWSHVPLGCTPRMPSTSNSTRRGWLDFGSMSGWALQFEIHLCFDTRFNIWCVVTHGMSLWFRRWEMKIEIRRMQVQPAILVCRLRICVILNFSEERYIEWLIAVQYVTEIRWLLLVYHVDTVPAESRRRLLTTRTFACSLRLVPGHTVFADQSSKVLFQLSLDMANRCKQHGGLKLPQLPKEQVPSI